MIVWYLHHYAKPGPYGSPGRPYYLARSLQALGHDVLVVAASDHHTRIRPAPPEDVNHPRIYDGARYYHLPTRPYRGNGLNRLMNMLDYARSVRLLASRVVNGHLPKPDVLIPSCAHIFSFPPAYDVAKRFDAGLIYEARDLWPLSITEVAGVPGWHPLLLWMAHIERRAYRQADAVVSLLPGALEYMQGRGLDPQRFYCIPNGVSAEEWASEGDGLAAEHQGIFDQYRSQGKMIVVYAGAHGPPNALDQILDLKKVTRGEAVPYHFILIGDGIEKGKLQARVKNESVDFVSFIPRLPKRNTISAIRQADVCFIGWKKLDIYRYGISPNKLGDYFMAGKPVLHAVCAGNDPVKEAGAGVSVDPYQPEQLDRGLRKLASMRPEERASMGLAGRKYALDNLEWSILGKRYAEIFDRIAPGKGKQKAGGAS